MDNVPRQPPSRFTPNDTLWFKLYFPDYLPENGWSMELFVTDFAGINKAQAVSAANEDAHEFAVKNFANGLPAGEYYLSIFAVNGGEGFRHRVYYLPLTLMPDIADGAGTPLTTHAQRQIKAIEEQLEYMSSHVLDMTAEQRTEFHLTERPKLMQQLREYKEIRTNEIQMERSRNGQPIGNTLGAVFIIG